MYKRKTKDVYTLYGNYGYGWEELYDVDNKAEAIADFKCYTENEPQYKHKWSKRRVPIENNSN